jgi:hypothetical protein
VLARQAAAGSTTEPAFASTPDHRNAPVLGFHRRETHSTLDIEQCPVLAPALERGLPDVRAALAKMPSREWPYQIEGACGHDGAAWAPDLPDLPKDLIEHDVGGFRFLIEPESFFQGNRHLVDQLVSGAIGDERGELAFDLYAGVGLFSLPLSRRFTRVVAVEDERRAATLGRVNAKTNGCDNVRYLRRTTEQFLRANRERPDLVLMDPPRLGAKPAIPLLLKLRARRLVDVSCDPQTLARDLRTLVDGGNELEQVEGYDMLPQTFHVEAVARLRLADRCSEPNANHDRNPSGRRLRPRGRPPRAARRAPRRPRPAGRVAARLPARPPHVARRAVGTARRAPHAVRDRSARPRPLTVGR